MTYNVYEAIWLINKCKTHSCMVVCMVLSARADWFAREWELTFRPFCDIMTEISCLLVYTKKIIDLQVSESNGYLPSRERLG